MVASGRLSPPRLHPSTREATLAPNPGITASGKDRQVLREDHTSCGALASNPAVIANANVRDVFSSKFSRRDLHGNTDRATHSESLIQGTTSSVVNAYDSYPNGTSQISYDPRHTGINNFNRSIHKTYSQPKPFNGTRCHWPEFRSVWLRYATMFYDDVNRACELNQILAGEALEMVQPIFATQPQACEKMMCRLEEVYNDPSISVQAVFNNLQELKLVKEGDARKLVKIANAVESSYSQFSEVGLLQAFTLSPVDTLANLLPTSIRRDWDRHFHILTHEERIKPFPHLMRFLEQEQQIALRGIETVNPESSSMHKQKVKVFYTESSGPKSSSNRSNNNNKIIDSKNYWFIHRNKRHCLVECRNFLALSVDGRYKLIPYVLGD